MGSKVTSAWSQLLKSSLKIILQMTINIYCGLKGYPFVLLNLCKKKIFGNGKWSTLVFLPRKHMLVSLQVWGRQKWLKFRNTPSFLYPKCSVPLHCYICQIEWAAIALFFFSFLNGVVLERLFANLCWDDNLQQMPNWFKEQAPEYSQGRVVSMLEILGKYYNL